MKIKHVELNNFRQFYGVQYINFSTHKEKNITLIHAENGTGKTAFLNAILWCFYEIYTSNFKDPGNLINKVAKSEGRNFYSVAIDFEDDDGNFFRVKRGYGINGTTFKVLDALFNEVNNPNSFINSVIPKDMAKYFFFQGEGVGKISGSKGGAAVKTAVREILGFTIAENALKDVLQIKKEYQKSFSNADKTGQLAKIQNEIISLEENIERNLSQIIKYEEAIDLYSNKLVELENKLASSNSSVIKQLHGQRTSIEKNLSREKSLLIDSQSEKRELISEFATIAFGFELTNVALDFIDEAEYKGTVPAPFNEQLVKDILEQAKCICGRDISPGTEVFRNIQNLLKDASDPALESRIRKARAQLTSMQNASTRAKAKFSNNLKALSDAEENIVRLEHEIEELSIKIKGSESIEDINKIENERSRLKKNLSQDERSHERLKIETENSKKLLEQRKIELGRLDSYSAELKKYKNLVEFSGKIEIILKETLSSAEKDVEFILIEKINKYLQLFVRQDYKAKLNKNTFDIRLVDKDENIIPESDGQALLVSLTFISSLIELSRERKNAHVQILTPGTVAPFIVDAPFGDLDNKYKGHVANAIPKSVEQVVFLLSSSHWEGTVEENIRPRIGAEYNMVLEVTSPPEGKVQDYINIQKTKYETVRYNSPLEKTIIEEVGTYV